jgi:regulatory protein
LPSAEEWLAQRGLSPAVSRQSQAPSEPAAGPVADAVRFIRRSTARTPQSSQRIRDKLLARGVEQHTADEAIDLVTQTGEINDDAFAAALVNEWLARGHAPRRIAYDLRNRGFAPALIAQVLATHSSHHDPNAAAFAVALDRASALLALPPEAALRRLTGHVARRGYSAGVASKAARDALYAARQQIESAEA